MSFAAQLHIPAIIAPGDLARLSIAAYSYNPRWAPPREYVICYETPLFQRALHMRQKSTPERKTMSEVFFPSPERGGHVRFPAPIAMGSNAGTMRA